MADKDASVTEISEKKRLVNHRKSGTQTHNIKDGKREKKEFLIECDR